MDARLRCCADTGFSREVKVLQGARDGRAKGSMIQWKLWSHWLLAQKCPQGGGGQSKAVTATISSEELML